MNITWVGFGAMGLPMARRLTAAGYRVSGVGSTQEKTELLLRAGINVCPSLPVAVEKADTVISMVPGPNDVRRIWIENPGLLNLMRPGATAIDMSTVGSASAIELAAKGASVGVKVLDCPVSGGVDGATNGNLTIFAGGDTGQRPEVSTMLSVLGRVIPCGAAGSGQRAKLVNQVIVALNTYALCLAYALTERSGIDKNLMFDALTGGAADGRLLRLEWPFLLNNDISSGFALEHMLKDINLVLPLLEESQLPTEVLRSAQAEFERTARTLGGSSATQGLALKILNTITSRRAEEEILHD